MPSEGKFTPRAPRLPGQSNLRASAAERAEAARKLAIYQDQGYLADHEVAERQTHINNALTPKELNKIFADLPALGPSQLVERRVGQAERNTAMNHLEQALDNQQIDVAEFHAAQDMVQTLAVNMNWRQPSMAWTIRPSDQCNCAPARPRQEQRSPASPKRAVEEQSSPMSDSHCLSVSS